MSLLKRKMKAAKKKAIKNDLFEKGELRKQICILRTEEMREKNYRMF